MTLKTCSVKEKASVKTKNSTTKKASNGQFKKRGWGMSEKIALSLCDKSGIILKPWAEKGYRCIAVDIQHKGIIIENGIEYTEGDVRDYLPPNGEYIFACAFPPCTHLAVSGAKHFKTKGLKKLKEAIEIVEACEKILKWTEAPFFIENPVSVLSTHWRLPDYKFDPCDYGDPYTKKTCLWTGGNFIMPEKNPIEPTEGSKMHRLPPSPDRADLRSLTPKGFSLAVFLSNSKELKP